MPFLRHATSDAKHVYVGSGSSAPLAKRVMVGTGTSAVEVWPGIYPLSMDFNFPDQEELKWAPVVGFDSRTATSSNYTPSFIFNDMLVAGDNPNPSYHVRLVNHQVDVLPLEFIVTLGDIVAPNGGNSSVILSSNITMTKMIVAEFHSGGFRVYTLREGVMYPTTPHSYSVTLSAGDQVRIRLEADRVFVQKVGGSGTAFVFPTHLDAVRTGDGFMYFGFGLYSTNGLWSSRIQRIQINGQTTYKPVFVASDRLRKVTPARDVWAEVARSQLPMEGSAPLYLTNAAWQNTSSSGRFFRVLRNGTEIGRTASNGTSLSLGAQSYLANDIITVEAMSSSSTTNQRAVAGGYLQIGDPSLAVT